ETDTTNPSSTTAPVTPRAQRSEGRQSLQHDARALHRLRVPAGSARVVALADSFWIAPAPLQVERRGEWHVRAPASLEAGMATPAGLRVELADQRPIRARVTARVDGRTLPLERQPDDAYHVVLDGLPPGLHRAEITAVQDDGRTARDTVLVYARPHRSGRASCRER